MSEPCKFAALWNLQCCLIFFLEPFTMESLIMTFWFWDIKPHQSVVKAFKFSLIILTFKYLFTIKDLSSDIYCMQLLTCPLSYSSNVFIFSFHNMLFSRRQMGNKRPSNFLKVPIFFLFKMGIQMLQEQHRYERAVQCY